MVLVRSSISWQQGSSLIFSFNKKQNISKGDKINTKDHVDNLSKTEGLNFQLLQMKKKHIRRSFKNKNPEELQV